MIDSRIAPYAALILRVALGVMFLAHSLYLKLVVVQALIGDGALALGARPGLRESHLARTSVA